MHTGPMPLMPAELNEHTAALLDEYAPAEVVVIGRESPRATLTDAATVAAAASTPLVVADAELRAEANALANLLDVDEPRSAVLLSYSGEESANVRVLVGDDMCLADTGEEAFAAGIFVVAPADAAAFAAALTARAGLLAGDAPTDTFELALLALREATNAEVVAAEPFCASRGAMDLPARSEDDRRLRAATRRPEDPVTAKALRPLSRRITAWAVAGNRTSATLAIAGLVAGLVAAVVTSLGNLFALIAGAIVLQVASLALLSSGEIARYWRRPTAMGARRYRLVSRVVELTFLLGLGAAAAQAGWTSWILAIAAIGLTAVVGDVVAGRRDLRDRGAADDRALRWLAISVATILAGPVWGLVAAAIGAGAVVAVEVARAVSDPRVIDTPAPRNARFLVPPGAMSDSGVLVRILSNTVGLRIPVAPRWLMVGGVSLFALTALLSWNSSPWFLVVGVAGLLAAMASVMSETPAGRGAWALPAILRAAEVLAIMSVASGLAVAGQWVGALLAAAMVLVTLEGADRWHYARKAPPAWASVLDLGFDGRLVIVVVAAVFGQALGAMWLVTGILAATWVGLVLTFPGRASRTRARTDA